MRFATFSAVTVMLLSFARARFGRMIGIWFEGTLMPQAAVYGFAFPFGRAVTLALTKWRCECALPLHTHLIITVDKIIGYISVQVGATESPQLKVIGTRFQFTALRTLY